MKRTLLSITTGMVSLSAFALAACTPRLMGPTTIYPGTGPAVVYASIDLSCGDKTYTVSTGNNKGECRSSGQNAVCADNAGNSTEVSCASGCMNAKGSASCSIKAQ